ncbi:hypothetical protein CC2G_001973 [Coprinopsis cinerea AmutBmut pab1-1]|nr:hypothetical protein CC2G_001973 [Coprinopsis cinerea AmutBmut pab1-1]
MPTYNLLPPPNSVRLRHLAKAYIIGNIIRNLFGHSKMDTIKILEESSIWWGIQLRENESDYDTFPTEHILHG